MLYKQVLEVNGISLRSVSHETAISTLRRTPTKVRCIFSIMLIQHTRYTDVQYCKYTC